MTTYEALNALAAANNARNKGKLFTAFAAIAEQTTCKHGYVLTDACQHCGRRAHRETALNRSFHIHKLNPDGSIGELITITREMARQTALHEAKENQCQTVVIMVEPGEKPVILDMIRFY